MPAPVFGNVTRAAESDSDKKKAAGTRSTITVMETWYALLLLVCGLGAYIAAHFASLRGGDLVRLGLILFSPFAFLMVGVALSRRCRWLGTTRTAMVIALGISLFPSSSPSPGSGQRSARSPAGFTLRSAVEGAAARAPRRSSSVEWASVAE